MIQHDDPLRAIRKGPVSDPGQGIGQVHYKLDFRPQEVDITQLKMALSLMRIAFPAPEAYTVTDEYLLLEHHETKTHDPKALSAHPASRRQAW